MSIGVPSNILNLSSGLVGWWTFDGKDVVNGVIRDKSGQGNHGNAINIASSTFYTKGKVGQAGNFDGGDDYVSVSNNSSFKPTGAMTISGWFKGSGTSATVSGLGTQGGGSTRGYNFGVNNSKDATFIVATSSTEIISLTVNDLHDNNIWNHYVAVFTPSVSLEIYKNGISIGQNTTGIPVEQYQGNNRAFRIGERGNNDAWFDGFLDDVRIYNRALSASEVSALYNSTAGSKVSASQSVGNTNCTSGLSCGLVGYWTFDGGDVVNGVIRDMSGQGNHGNAMNIASSTFYAKGKVGQAGKFDGVNDYIKEGSDFIGTSAISISAWMYPRSFGNGNLGRIVSNSRTEFFVNSTNSILSFTGNGGTNIANSTNSSVVLNRWSFVTATRDSTGSITNIYINGVLSGTANQNSGAPVNGTSNVVTGIRLASTQYYFNGSLDDIRIYNRALSATEVRQLYNMGR